MRGRVRQRQARRVARVRRERKVTVLLDFGGVTAAMSAPLARRMEWDGALRRAVEEGVEAYRRGQSA